MSPYPVLCYANDCKQPATFKIAAQWSDGVTRELKTYYLACATCVHELYQIAKTKKATCRVAVGETLSDPMIYELVRGQRDRELLHRPERES